MSKYDELVSKLREIFQIDRPELDFGVYRILNARADEINAYLSTRLKERVAEALASGAAANVDAQQRELDETIKNLKAADVDPDTSPKVQALKNAIAAASSGASEHENAVFSHLLAFFSRYYDKGDFISQRRYKGDTYAIPYAGEEVVLHWANKDQYYTKSGEAFSNYAFKLDDGRTVHFRLISADTAKDNRKDNDKERRFALAEARTVTRVDDEGEAYEEQIVPVSEDGDDLIVRFEYRAFPAKTKQETLVDQAVEAVLADEAVKDRWLGLTQRAPTEKKPQRTLLEKHLTTYTQKNTADYFIHKDLGGFLRRELDFYIKNEVMNLDDVQDAASFGAIEKNLRMIQCLRAIALDLITFLASIEEFQKKLWLKKKFVVSAHYCVTLDRVPEALYPAIAANEAQWTQWHDLGMRKNAKPGTVEELKADSHLMVDTALFDEAFKADLLKAISDVDTSTDGLLVHGDNFQALTLLRERYREQVKCIYIDPPYNSPSSEIAYKNSFKHSSWLTLMDNRLQAAKPFQPEDAGLVVAIDKHEQNGLVRILGEGFSDKNVVQVTIEHNKKGVQGDGFSFNHEYAVFVIPPKYKTRRKELPDAEWEWANLRNWGGESLRTDAKNCFYPIFVKNDQVVGFGEVCPDDFHPESANVEMPDGTLAIYPIDQEGDERKWRYERGTVEGIKHLLKVTFARDKTTRQVMKAKNTDQFKTSWYSPIYNAGDYGTAILTRMGFPKDIFDNPKSIHTVMDSVGAICSENQTVMDYFAGSGTTAHSLIKMKRDLGESRRYILVDQGEYVPTLIRPRIQKVVFSADWEAGRPTKPETGISHAFKTLKIESYEDTLNNLALTRDESQKGLLDGLNEDTRDDYLMRYMLDVEARGSLLSVEDFRKPFDYELNIAVDSAGAYERRKVDLVETFNYLIGLTVKTIDMQLKQGFTAVEGTLPTGERTLVLWRDCDKIGYEELTKLCDKLAINPSDSEYEVVYINGDHNIPSVVQTSEEEGGIEKRLKLRQIEPAFLEAMFDVSDA
ncbi:site-specific DNA-methyltransferase [Alteriqipengyuania sp. WL0013]|uniref:site-specific DNA-methyltransferase n=1 Tax=Alteriqipengyuania sp. WL0013 TaxID=3110773 RepID=UPI002CBBA871|nr:site-specific DNA-methyltransferase [Alteriqipengyuania sp. WL0013]MEB3415004.1 site-specific DNA-methyltransferase [Alteriqipengyuania sp. WL0013]